MITDKEIQLVVDSLMQETENSNKGFCLCVIRLLQEIKNQNRQTAEVHTSSTDIKEQLIISLCMRGLISENDKYKLLLELKHEKSAYKEITKQFVEISDQALRDAQTEACDKCDCPICRNGE